MRCFRVKWSVVLAAIAAGFLAGCGSGASQEELEAARSDLEAARSQLQSLRAEKLSLETKMAERTLEDLGNVLNISAVMTLPPTVVELIPDSASLQMVTKVPTTCSIVWGLTARYGQISTDDNMSPGGHTDHYHTLKGLKPNTVYHYGWGLLGPGGNLYGSPDLTFKTPPAAGGTSQQ